MKTLLKPKKIIGGTLMTFGEKIKFYRLQKGLTQDRLAFLCNVHPVSIRKYETNKMKPKFEQMVRISKALDLAPCFFCEYYKEVC